MTQPPAAPPPAADASRPGCGSYLMLAGAVAWVVFASAIVQVVAWYVDQVLYITGLEMPAWVWVPISWAHVAVLALPIGLLAFLSQPPLLRAIYRGWLAALLYIAIVALARAYPRTWALPAALTQVVLSLLFAAGLLAFFAYRRQRLRGRPAGVAGALALAPLVAAPYLVWGSLGSPWDTVLNVLAGLSLGLVAGLLLDGFVFRPLGAALTRLDLAAAALACIGALTILGSGFGFGGTQLLLLLVLPPLGLAAAGLGVWITSSGAAARPAAAWPAVGLLVGLAAAAPLIMVDPDELLIVLGNSEIMDWALRAGLAALFVALLVGAAVLAGAGAMRMRQAAAGSPARGTAAGTAAALALAAITWLGGGLVYSLAGQPGFYGDRLFVVLRDQADLSGAAGIADRNERLAYVYDTLVAHADATQANLRAALDRVGVPYQPYYLVNAIEVEGGPLLRVYLSLQPEVDRVLSSPRLRPLPAPPPVGEGYLPAPEEPQWNLTSIGADRVWQEFGVTGEGIVVGQSDSGVQGDHEALAAAYRGAQSGHDYNWFDPWNGTTEPTDVGGHGTHTLGTILGANVGVAPGAQWFGCVNLYRNLANPALYLDCMQFMLAPFPLGGDPLRDGDPSRAAHVINNSWGCPPIEGCDAASLAPAVSALRAAGIFVVVSAGNEGPNCESIDVPPAIYDEAFSVGAVDRFGDLAFFSSRGPVTVDGSNRPKPDISAPGVAVWSATPDGAYGENSGTSMAGPHVAGAVALLWSANPDLIGDIDRTEALLLDTARPYTGHDTGPGECDNGPVPNNGVGYGVLDVYAAVSAALGGR